MKRILILFLSVVCVQSCFLIPDWIWYYELKVTQVSDEESMLSCLGDTCWFKVAYQRVDTKFQPGIGFEEFRYIIEIGGQVAEGPVSIEGEWALADLTDELKEKFPDFFEEWYLTYGGYPVYSEAVIPFAVPANDSSMQRTVEVKVDMSDNDESEEWETVFSAIQEGC